MKYFILLIVVILSIIFGPDLAVIPTAAYASSLSSMVGAGPSTLLGAGPSTLFGAGPSTLFGAGPSTLFGASPSTLLGAGDIIQEVGGFPWLPVNPTIDETISSPAIQIIAVSPTFFFLNNEGALFQIITVRLENHLNSQTTGNIEIKEPERGKTDQGFTLLPGTNDLLFLVADLREPALVEIRLFHKEQLQQRLLFNWEPARQWKVYVSQTSHFDNGYTGLQQVVMDKQDKILDDVLDFCSITDNWPEESKFRWIVEASYCLEHYLKTHPWREEEIRQRVAQGRIEIGAGFSHLESSTAGHEELVRNLYYSTIRVADRFNTDIVTFVHSDVDGITWGSPAALAGAGIRYLSFNPNVFYRGGNILARTKTPQAYYWLGPGGHKVLTWRSRQSYYEAGFLLQGLGATLVNLPLILLGYENEGYPYDAIHFTRTGSDSLGFFVFTDNSSPHLEVCDTVRRWNDLFEYPKLFCATSSQFFRYLEDTFSDEIPEISGDCPDWWADGVLTGAVAEGLSRAVHHKLIEAETLASIDSILQEDHNYPQDKINSAWENALLFDEHTWGFIAPFLPQQDAIWDTKVEFVNQADQTTDGVIRQALANVARRTKGEGWKLFVFNPMSWDRDDVVAWRPPSGFPHDYLDSNYFRILNSEEIEIPYQISETPDGQIEIVFLSGNVPSVGYVTYQIVSSGTKPEFQNDLVIEDHLLENTHYQITFSQNEGITSFYDKLLNKELIDHRAPYRMNEFISRQQGLFDQQDNKKQEQIKGYYLKDNGPVFASVVFEVADPDNPESSITNEVRLYDRLKRVDFINSVENFTNRLGESKYFAFPFAVPDFEFHLDIPLGVMRPFFDQLPNFAKYYAVQHWIDISSPSEGFGITWAPLEGPIVELGEITKKASWARTLMWPIFYDPGEYPYEPKFSHIYSEIMNNFQVTNFNYFQVGSGAWRYSVTTHKGNWDQPAVTRFGWDLAAPLMAEYFAADPEGSLPESSSFFRVRPQNVKILAVKMAEDANGYIVRLFENEGIHTQVTLETSLLKNVQASLLDLAEREQEKLIVENNKVLLDLTPFNLETVRITGEKIYSPESEGDNSDEAANDDDFQTTNACGC